MIKQDLNYVKKKFKKLQYVPNPIDLELIKKSNIDIKNYNKLNLRENGVKYVKIKDDKVLNSIDKLSKECMAKKNSSKKINKLKHNLGEGVKKYLDNFLKSKSKSGIKNFSDNFTDIIILERAIRTTEVQDFSVAKKNKVNTTASWFHTDWWEGQSFSSMIISRFAWLEELKKYGPAKYSKIENLEEWSCFWDSKYVELVNVWIPLSETTEAAPLVFSDMNNTDYSDILPYTYKVHMDDKNFYYEIATRLRYNKNQKLYAKEDMKLGEAVIFTSNKTPHSSYRTNKTKIPRRSIEFRCVLLNFDSEQADKALNKLYENK